MSVRYNPLVVWVMLLFGPLGVLMSLWNWSQTGAGFDLFLMAWTLWATVYGVLCQRRPYFVLTPKSVKIPGVTGIFKTESVIQDGGGLTVSPAGRLVLVRADGSHKRLRITKTMAHPEDWKAAVSKLPAAQPR